MARVRLSKLEKHRLRALKDIDPALQEVAATITAGIATEARDELLKNRDLGVRVDTILKVEGAYGFDAVTKLAAHIRCSPEFLYDLRDLARIYSKDEITALTRRQMPDGSYLSTRHLLLLIKAKTDAEREQLTERVFNENLSVRQLAKLCTPPPRASPKPVRPKRQSPSVAAQDAIKHLTAISARIPVWNSVLVDEVLQMPSPQVDAALQASLLAAREVVGALSKELMQLEAAMTEPLERVTKIIALCNAHVTVQPVIPKPDQPPPMMSM